MQDLFSVLVICYRHFEFLYEAIDSVLSQDYPRIELIVSDDGSEDFPREKVLDYIEHRKRENIVNVIVRQEPTNCGTVRHLNHAVKLCTGEYVAFLAGDDVFADGSVFTKYQRGFSNAGDNCYIEMAQTGMYDETLSTLEDCYPKVSTQKAIERTAESSDELLRHLLRHGACLPTASTCFKREFFGRFGQFDERFRLIEDYPMHMRLAKEGWVIHYESFVACKHRHGGISHGQQGALKQSSIAYYEDSRRAVKDVLLDNVNALPPEQARQVIHRRKMELWWLEYQLAVINNGRWGIIRVLLKSPLLTIRKLMERVYPTANRFKKKLLLGSVFLWLTAADIDCMFAQLLLMLGIAPAGSLQTAICVLAVCSFILWLALFAVWGVCGAIWKIERFSTEWLVIG